jgi:hypothetical protein
MFVEYMPQFCCSFVAFWSRFHEVEKGNTKSIVLFPTTVEISSEQDDTLYHSEFEVLVQTFCSRI